MNAAALLPEPVRRRLRAAGLRRPRGQRGTFTIVVIFWTMMTVVMGTFLIDSGLAIGARQQAVNIAEEAARAVANDLDAGALRDGQIVIHFNNDGTCTDAQRQAAIDVLEGFGADFTAANLITCEQDPSRPYTYAGNVVDPVLVPVVLVTVSIPYSVIFGSLFFNETPVASGTATAYPEPGV